MSVSIVVPCYRSAATLERLVDRIDATLGPTGTVYEVILTVDGSPDDTWLVAAALAASHPTVRALRLSRNYGQHAALLAGIRSARHDVVVTMDDDLQHRPEQLPRLLEALTPDCELVYGVAREEEHGWARSVASRGVKTVISSLTGTASAREVSALRAFRAHLRDAFANISGPDVNLDVALAWATTQVSSVAVDMDEREEGRSNYTPTMLVRHALNMILGYSTAPLRFVIYLGFGCGLVGLILLAVILYEYFTDRIQVAGFTTLASMIAIFSSAQLIAVGVLGEYIGRLHHTNAGRPTYVVRESTDGAPSGQV